MGNYSQFAFDIKLNAVVRVAANDALCARAGLVLALDVLDLPQEINVTGALGVESVHLTNASLDPDADIHLFEEDNQAPAISPQQAHALLRKSRAVLVEGHLLASVETAQPCGDPENEIASLTWHCDGVEHTAKIAENCQPRLDGRLDDTILILTDTEGETLGLVLLSQFDPQALA